MTFLIFLLNIFYFSDVIMGIHTSTDGSYITDGAYISRSFRRRLCQC